MVAVIFYPVLNEQCNNYSDQLRFDEDIVRSILSRFCGSLCINACKL